jgi:hypothetical protein
MQDLFCKKNILHLGKKENATPPKFFWTRESTYGWMVRRALLPLDLTLWYLIKVEYSSVGGDVSVDSEALVVTSSISIPAGLVLRCSILNVLIVVGCACVCS